jgi:hypothetical protein
MRQNIVWTVDDRRIGDRYSPEVLNQIRGHCVAYAAPRSFELDVLNHEHTATIVRCPIPPSAALQPVLGRLSTGSEYLTSGTRHERNHYRFPALDRRAKRQATVAQDVTIPWTRTSQGHSEAATADVDPIGVGGDASGFAVRFSVPAVPTRRGLEAPHHSAHEEFLSAFAPLRESIFGTDHAEAQRRRGAASGDHYAPTVVKGP